MEEVGGWFGGNGQYHKAGSGGSGFVYASSTWTNSISSIVGTKWLLNSNYYLRNAETKAGNQSFPNVAGTGNETGHSGNGAAKITPVN